MAIRSDIRFSSAIKEVNGSTAVSGNQYGRAIYHTAHAEFVMVGFNGIVYSLDGAANKVQQTPGIPGAALPFLASVVQDYRDGQSTIVGDGQFIAIDDGALNNWVVGARAQSHRGVFTLAGDSNMYFIFERLVISDDNFVANLVNGIDIFNFPGIQTITQTQNGTRVVVAGINQVGFVDSGTDPNVLINWNIEPQAAGVGIAVNQIAVNNAGTLAIMTSTSGIVIRWQLGAAPPVIYPPENNPFLNTQAAGVTVSSVIYSAFWEGFILYSASRSIVGFIDETNFTEIDSGIFLGFIDAPIIVDPLRGPVGAANPAGEIIICPSTSGDPHELIVLSP